MRTPDFSHDPVLASLTALGPRDVGRARADRLRRRSHAALSSKNVARDDSLDEPVWRRLGPAVAGAWCAVYVFETIRRAAAFYWW